jgi:hypothetical protein
MSKKFLFLIALSLYVVNSNCAAAKESAEDSKGFSKVAKALNEAQDIPAIHDALNKFFFTLQRSNLNKKQRFAALSGIRHIMAKKVKALSESDFKDKLNRTNNVLFEYESMTCSHNKPQICCIECPLIFVSTPLAAGESVYDESAKKRCAQDTMAAYSKLLAESMAS